MRNTCRSFVPFLAFAIAFPHSLLHGQSLSVRQLGPDLLISRGGAEIQLDGVLQEPSWKSARVIEGFRPHLSATMPHPTQVRAVHSDKTVWLGITCFSPSHEALVAAGTEGGALWRDDSIEIFLDPIHDGRQIYQIVVNAAGTVTVIDKTAAQQRGRGTLVDAKASWDEQQRAYTLEIALDRAALAITDHRAASIGLAFMRNHPVGGRRTYSAWALADNSGSWGHLFLLDDHTLGLLKQDYSRRLAAVLRLDIPGELRRAAEELQPTVDDLTAGDTPAVAAAEEILLALEKRAHDDVWRMKFKRLFD